MRRLFMCSMLLAVAACASTDVAPGMRQTCEDRYDEVWMAAQTAVMRLGGKVEYASRSSGSILGRLEVDVLGTVVELHISLSRIPDHRPDTQEPVTVKVRAAEPGSSEPEPARAVELRSLEERYLRLIGERVACGGPS